MRKHHNWQWRSCLQGGYKAQDKQPANKPKIGLVMKNLNGIFKGGAWSKDKEELNIKLISWNNDVEQIGWFFLQGVLKALAG